MEALGPDHDRPAGQLVKAGSKGKVSPEPVQKITAVQVLVLLVAVGLTNSGLIVGFSDVGFGSQAYSWLVTRLVNDIGTLVLVAALVIGMCFYIEDWNNWSRRGQVLTGWLVYELLCVALCMKALSWPWAPMMAAMLHTPLFILMIRMKVAVATRRRQFYGALAIITGLCCLGDTALQLTWVMLGKGWKPETITRIMGSTTALYEVVYDKRALVYESDCGPAADRMAMSSEERQDVALACFQIQTTQFLVWACPVVGAAWHALMALCAFVMGVHLDVTQPKGLEFLKLVVVLFFVLLMAMYVSASIKAVSQEVGTVVLVFIGATVFWGLVWVYVEMGLRTDRHNRDLPLVLTLLRFYHSGWARGTFLAAFGSVLPVFYAVDHCRQRRLRCAGEADDNGRWTRNGLVLTRMLREFPIATLLKRICSLGELFFILQIGIAKGGYAMLTELSEYVSRDGYVSTLVYTFGYSVAMLLLPIPAAPVCVFCAITICRKSLEDGGNDWDFYRNVLIAIGIAICSKLIALAVQYELGNAVGRRPGAQQSLGVELAPMKALEQVLKSKVNFRGLTLHLAGPQWFTGVCCGVLRVGFRVTLEIGALEILITVLPCAFAGASLARKNESMVWHMSANLCIGVVSAFEVASLMMALDSLMQVLEHYEEINLLRERPEHHKAEELQELAIQRRNLYRKATEWRNLGRLPRALGILGAALMVVACVAYSFASEVFFRRFSLASKFNDPFEEEGLEGKIANIIIEPVGWYMLGCFLAGAILHMIFARYLSHVYYVQRGHEKASKDLEQLTADPPTRLRESAGGLPGAVVGRPEEQGARSDRDDGLNGEIKLKKADRRGSEGSNMLGMTAAVKVEQAAMRLKKHKHSKEPKSRGRHRDRDDEDEDRNGKRDRRRQERGRHHASDRDDLEDDADDDRRDRRQLGDKHESEADPHGKLPRLANSAPASTARAAHRLRRQVGSSTSGGSKDRDAPRDRDGKARRGDDRRDREDRGYRERDRADRERERDRADDGRGLSARRGGRDYDREDRRGGRDYEDDPDRSRRGGRDDRGYEDDYDRGGRRGGREDRYAEDVDRRRDDDRRRDERARGGRGGRYEERDRDRGRRDRQEDPERDRGGRRGR